MHHFAYLTESSGSLGPTLTVVTVVCFVALALASTCEQCSARSS